MRYKLLIPVAFAAVICGVSALGAAAIVAAGGNKAEIAWQPNPDAPHPLVLAAQKTPETPAPAAPAAAPAAPASDPLLGDWRVVFLGANESASLKIEKVSRGIIGAALNGALVTSDGKSCPLSGAIFENIAGMYPDGAKIVTMDVAGLMRVAAKCDATSISIDAFILNDKRKFRGAGRATTLPAPAGKPSVALVDLEQQ